MLKTLWLGAALLVLLGGAARAQSTDWAKVEAEAKTEGKVVIYSPLANDEKDIFKAFEAKYHIPVEVFQARGSEVMTRMQTEQNAGRYLGDVLQTSDDLLVGSWGQYLQPHAMTAEYGDKLIAPFKMDPVRVPNVVLPFVLIANTDEVTPDKAPKSWLDLLDPRWKDKIHSDVYWALGAGQVWFDATMAAFGEDYHRKLAKQNLVFDRNNTEDAQRVGRDEFPLYLPLLLPRVLPLNGLPVHALPMKEGAPYTLFDVAMLKNAPHPNAARLLMNFMLTPDQQLVYGNNAEIPVVQGVKDRVTGPAKELVQFQLMGTPTPVDVTNKNMTLSKSIYAP